MTASEKLGRLCDHLTLERLSSVVVSLLVLWDRIRRELRKSDQELQRVEVQTITNNREIKMEKAYDLKDLAARLKSRGLDVAEEGARVVIEELDAWLVESAAISENKFDDLAAIGIPQLEKLALGLVDKIDGKVDAK